MEQDVQQEIFHKWITKHRALLFKVIRSYAFNAVDRDDLFQEIVLQIWRSIPNFKQNSAVTTWMYRVALNTSIKWINGEKKSLKIKRELTENKPILQNNEEAQNDRLDWLYTQIGELNEIDRSITLLMLDGFRYKEMAKVLGITESNVGIKINRIKKYLIRQANEIM